MKTTVSRSPLSSHAMNDELSLSEPSASAGRGPALIMGWVGVAAALLVALVMPLGASEAAAIGWLKAATAAGWGEPFRHVVMRGWSEGQPMVALTLAALLAKVVPTLGLLCALRLPDVLAAGLVTGALVRLAQTPAAGVLAGLVFMASPMLWAGVVGPPGLVIDAGAGVLLYAFVARVQAQRPAAGLAGALIAIAMLAANGAGLYATAIVGGLYLHRGLAHGEWRLAGSLRLTVLAWLALAGLTLTSALDLPDLDRGFDLINALTRAATDSGLHGAWILVVAVLAGVSLVALIATLARPAAGSRGGPLLVLILGLGVLLAAATTSVWAVATLAPLLALWWISPLTRRQPSAAGRAIGVVYALLLLAGAAGLLIVGRVQPVGDDWMVWTGRIVAGLFALAAVLLLWRLRRAGSAAAPAAAALAAVLAAGSLWLAPPQKLLPQRGFDHDLAAVLMPLRDRPIAVVAPVDPMLWRAVLGRPVFTAGDVSALCRWAGEQAGRQKPLALVRPGTTDAVTRRFDNTRLVAQSAGSPRTSVMVIELGPVDVSRAAAPSHHCR